MSFPRCLISVIAIFVAGGSLPAENPKSFDDDPLPVDSQWKGKFTQRGTHPQFTFPPELEATLTVVKREGDAIEIELREEMPGLDITFLCKGTVTRHADRNISLEFRSYDVKDQAGGSNSIINVPYSAKLVGDTIKGIWKYVDRDEGIDLGGDYSLKRE